MKLNLHSGNVPFESMNNILNVWMKLACVLDQHVVLPKEACISWCLKCVKENECYAWAEVRVVKSAIIGNDLDSPDLREIVCDVPIISISNNFKIYADGLVTWHNVSKEITADDEVVSSLIKGLSEGVEPSGRSLRVNKDLA